MEPDDLGSEDADVPELAVRALRAATERSIAVGQPQVLVRNGQLIRIVGDQIEVLKEMPARTVIPQNQRVKRTKKRSL